MACNLEKCTDIETVLQCSLDVDDDDVDDDDVDDDDVDEQTGQREMNEEEIEIYYRVVSASQGFDVPVFPNTMAIGRIEPINNPKERYTEELLKAATLSIEDYNKKNGSNYEVVEIIKANYMGVQGFIFFVTYSVKPTDTPAKSPVTIFQAKVYFGIGPDDIEIMICRPKPNEGEKELGGTQVGMQCSC